MFAIFGSFLSWYFLLPLYLRKMGANETEIGIAYLCFDVAACVFQFYGGYLADKFGRKKLITLPTFVFPLFYIIAANANNWITVSVMVVLGNLLSGFQIPSLYATVAESVKEKDRGLAFSIFEISLAAAFALGPALGSVFAGTIGGIKTLLYIYSGILLICAFIRQIWLRDVANHHEYKTNFRSVLGAFDRNLILLLLSFVFYTLMINTTIYGPFIALYSKDRIGLGEKAIQYTFMAGGILAVFFNLWSGRLTQKIGSKKAMIYGALGHSLLFIPWLFSKGLAASVVYYSVAYIFLQLSFIGHDTLMSDLTDIKTRSSIIGIFGLIPGVLGALAPPAGVKLSSIFGSHAPFYMAVIFSLITSAFLLMLKSDRI